MTFRLFALAAAVVGVVVSISTTPVQAAEDRFPGTVKLPKMTPALNLGKLNFDALCAACHGRNAAGTENGPTFLSRIYRPGHHSDGSFFVAPRRGVRAHHWRFGDMPPVDGITDRQIEKIIGYVRALQKANGIF